MSCGRPFDLRQQIPVIFEGDFWAEEAVRLARAVDRKDEGGEDGQSPLELSRCDFVQWVALLWMLGFDLCCIYT